MGVLGSDVDAVYSPARLSSSIFDVLLTLESCCAVHA